VLGSSVQRQEVQEVALGSSVLQGVQEAALGSSVPLQGVLEAGPVSSVLPL